MGRAERVPQREDGVVHEALGLVDRAVAPGLVERERAIDELFKVCREQRPDGAVVAGKMLDQKDANFGFDAQKGEYVDMIKSGIIDPVKVVRTALQDAASVAGLLITTEAAIVEAPKKGGGAGGPPGGGMGGMGDMDF